MRLKEVRQEPHAEWALGHQHFCEDVHYDDPHEVVEAYQPHVRMNLSEMKILNELTYKELAQGIDGIFLQQKPRADVLAPVEYIGFADSMLGRDGGRFNSPSRNIMTFHVKSSEYDDNGIIYPNTVLFEDWDEVGNDPATQGWRDKAMFLIWASNVRLNCNCESFFWWGYQYVLTQLDASIFPVNVFPKVRNPQVRGVVCKHMNRVLRSLPFYNGEIATEMRNQFGGGTP